MRKWVEEPFCGLRRSPSWRRSDAGGSSGVLVLTRAKPQRPLYNATSKVIEAMDDVAEVVTGDRRTFYQRDATTPGETLPPVKWRTVE